MYTVKYTVNMIFLDICQVAVLSEKHYCTKLSTSVLSVTFLQYAELVFLSDFAYVDDIMSMTNSNRFENL